MTITELLALPDDRIKALLLAHWNMQSFDNIEFTGFYKPNFKGTTGTLEDLCLVAPTDQPEPFPYSVPFGHEFRPVFHHIANDADGQPMRAGQAYRFSVKLSKPTKTARTDPFALVSTNVRPCTAPEHQRRIDELLTIGTSGPKRNQRQLANSLEQVGSSMYLEPNRFLFELLQNADDYPDPKMRNEVRVNFRLLTDYILFQHNGLPFLYRNVESIADVGNSTKSNERETTGYKGIGFKSVFGVSKWVYLRSNSYTFRFSAEGSATEPWHTWPRWTLSLPPELAADRRFADERRYSVSFALRIDPARVSGSTGYAAVLQKLLAQPQFALFLRHLSELTIEGVDLPTTRLRRTLDRRTGNTLFQVGDQKEEYSVTSYSIDARSKLEELIEQGITADKSFPEKLRDAHTVKVWFAARFDSTGNLEALPTSEAPLFSYLPTNDTSYGLPLLVNADFILAPNRVQVMSHHLWNAFLFHQIGFHLIQWIADQVQRDTSRAHTIYQFIPAAQYTNPNQEALNRGILAGVAAVACLPAADTGALKLLSDAVLDKPGLYQLLPNLYQGLLNDGLTVIHTATKASVEVANMIERFGLRAINWAEFKRVFTHAELTSYYQPADAARLLQYLAADTTIIAAEWRSIPWLFDQHDKLVAPNATNLYGTLEEVWDEHFPLVGQVRYLNLELQRVLQSSPTTATWVAEELRVTPYTRQAIVRGHLIAAACKLPTEADDTGLAIQYMYHLYYHKELQKWLHTTDSDRKKLAKLVIRCDDNKYRNLDNCYLSRHYQPLLELEEIAEEIGKAQFPLVSEAYLQGCEEPQIWREFWVFCGVRSPDAAGLLKTTLLPAGVQVAAWSAVKHEAVVRLAIDAFTKDPTFPRTELGKLKARTITGTASIADCVLPLEHNPNLALLAKIPIDHAPANTLAAEYFAITDSAAVANFYQAGGCKPWDEAKTLSYACEKLVEVSLNLLTSVSVVRQLYAWHQEKKLADSQKTILRALLLYQQDDSTRPAAETYFSSRYGPEYDIEQLSGGQQKKLLHESYLPTGMTELETESWRAFFADLGVVGKFQISVHPPLSRSKVEQRFSNYLAWADANPLICPYPYNAPKWQYQHTLQNFISINNLDLVTTEAVASLIAARIAKNAEWLLARPAPIYHTTHGNVSWPAGSVLNIFPVVPCTGVPSLRPAHEVYSKLLPAVPFGVPVATVTYGSRELEQRLGLLTTLTSEDALKILIQALPTDAVAGANITSTARNKFTATLYELQADLSGLRKPSPGLLQQLLLPAANNTWVPVDKAYFIANDEYIDPKSGLVLKSLPMLKSDFFQQFCVTLGAKLLDSKDFVDEDALSQSVDFSADFRARVARCKVLELIAHISGEPPEQVTSWAHKLAALRFLQVPSLRRKSLTIPNYTVPTNDNNSFADSTFLFVGSLFRGHWARLATFLIKELQLPRSIRSFLIANLLESRELVEQEEVLRAQKCEVPDWLLPVMPEALTNIIKLPVASQALTAAPTAEFVKTSVGSSSIDETGAAAPNNRDDEFVSDSSLSPEEQKTVHEQACKAAIEWLRANQYGLPSHIDEQFSVLSPVTTPDGKTIKIVVRSALKGRLFFHVHEWAELCEPDTLLLLFCRHAGNQPTILPVTNPAEQLVEANPNTYVRVPNSPLNAAVLQTLATDTYKHAPDFRYIFLHLPGPEAPPINLSHRRVEEILSADTSFDI